MLSFRRLRTDCLSLGFFKSIFILLSTRLCGDVEDGFIESANIQVIKCRVVVLKTILLQDIRLLRSLQYFIFMDQKLMSDRLDILHLLGIKSLLVHSLEHEVIFLILLSHLFFSSLEKNELVDSCKHIVISHLQRLVKPARLNQEFIVQVIPVLSLCHFGMLHDLSFNIKQPGTWQESFLFQLVLLFDLYISLAHLFEFLLIAQSGRRNKCRVGSILLDLLLSDLLSQKSCKLESLFTKMISTKSQFAILKKGLRYINTYFSWLRICHIIQLQDVKDI